MLWISLYAEGLAQQRRSRFMLHAPEARRLRNTDSIQPQATLALTPTGNTPFQDIKTCVARTLRAKRIAYGRLPQLATSDMKRTDASMLLLLASGANALSGLGVPSRVPSLALLCGQQPPAILGVRSRQSASRSYEGSAGGRTTCKRGLYCSCLEEPETQAPGQRDDRRKPPLPGHSCAPASGASPLKQTLAKIALAVILTPAVFIGGMTLPPVGVAGAGIGAVAPAYAELEPLPLKSYSEEFSSGLAPVNSVRGLWRTRETRSDGSALPTESGKLGNKDICRGRLSFKGFVGAGKGTVEYQGCGDREGKGRWLTKPKNVVNGRITLSARWKINFSDGTSLLYRGDVVQESEGTALTVDTSGAAAKGGAALERPDAHIRGEVLRPITNIQGSLSEKKIGEFEADLIELPSDEDKM